MKWLGGAKGFLVYRASNSKGVVYVCFVEWRLWVLNTPCVEFWMQGDFKYNSKLKMKKCKVGPITCPIIKWLYIYFNISNTFTHISNTKIKYAYESKEFVKHKIVKTAQGSNNLCIVF